MNSIIYCVTDKRRGHILQLLGLVKALKNIISAQVFWIDDLSTNLANLPNPTLIIGAGGATFEFIKKTKRERGGISIILMSPKNIDDFDLCIIPEHDHPQIKSNIIISRGTLHCYKNSFHKISNQAMLAIGGPSIHHLWDDSKMIEKIVNIINQNKSLNFCLATTPRTPESFKNQIQMELKNKVNFLFFQQTKFESYYKIFSRTKYLWITSDSLSLLFESLATGAEVKLIKVQINDNQASQNKFSFTEKYLEDSKKYNFSEETYRCAYQVCQRFGLKRP